MSPPFTRPSELPATELFRPREWESYLAVVFFPLYEHPSSRREVVAKVVGFDYIEDLEEGEPTRVVDLAVTSGRIAAALEHLLGGCVVCVIGKGASVPGYGTTPWVLLDLQDDEAEGYVVQYLAKMDNKEDHQ